MGRRAKDRSAYFEEAREMSRLFPNQRAHAIGNRMQAKYPDVRGLGQAVRKQIRKEELAASLSHRTPAPPPPAPPSPPASRPASRHRRNRTESVEVAIMKQLAKKAEMLKLIVDDAALTKQIVDQYVAKKETLEAMRGSPLYEELLRKLLSEDD